MSKSALFEFILVAGGIILIGTSSNWWVALGIFLFAWGNNHQLNFKLNERINQNEDSNNF